MSYEKILRIFLIILSNVILSNAKILKIDIKLISKLR